MRERGDEPIQLADRAVATICDDAALADRTREVLTPERRRVSLKLDGLLDPGNEAQGSLRHHMHKA